VKPIAKSARSSACACVDLHSIRELVRSRWSRNIAAGISTYPLREARSVHGRASC
jgi:hypothetical protein